MKITKATKVAKIIYKVFSLFWIWLITKDIMKIMDSQQITTTKSVNETYTKIHQVIITNDYKIISTVQNQSIQAEGSRDYGVGILIAFIILLWPVALIYYFTRKNNSITVFLNTVNEGCEVDIKSNGSSAMKVKQSIVLALQ